MWRVLAFYHKAGLCMCREGLCSEDGGPEHGGVDSSGPGLTPAPLPAFSLLTASGWGCPQAPLLKPQDMQLMLGF